MQPETSADEESQLPRRFAYRRTSRAGALALLAAAGVAVALLADPGWRLVAAAVGTGPLWWLIDETLRHRCAVRLTETHVVIEQPLPLFTRAVPYGRVVGVLKGVGGRRRALAYRKARTAARAQPQLDLVTFARIEKEEDFWGALLERVPAPLACSEAQVQRFMRERRFRRAALLLAALLSTPLVMIALSQIARTLR